METRRKSSIKLNNQQFFINEGSYRREIAPTTIPKFATGDLSYSDLTAWQFWAQSDWSGGFDQKFIIENNMYYNAQGIDSIERNGEIKMAVGASAINDGVVSSKIMCFKNLSSTLYAGVSGKGGFANPSALLVCYNPTSNIWDKVRYYNALNFVDLKSYRGRLFGSLYSYSADFIRCSAGFSTAMTENINSNFEEFNDRLYYGEINHLKYIDSTFTRNQDIDFGDLFWPYSLKYYNGKLYILGIKTGKNIELNLKCYDGNTIYDVYSFTETIGLMNSVTGFGRFAMEEHEGNLYITLCFTSGKNPRIYKFDGINIKLIYSEELYSVNLGYPHEIKSVAEKLLIAFSSAYPIFSLRDDKLNPYYTPQLNGLNKNIYTFYGFYLSEIGKTRIFLAPKSPSTGYRSAYISLENKSYHTTSGVNFLESSIIDFDLFNVDKFFGGFTVYHQPLTSGCSITLKIKIDNASSWTTIGTNNVANSVSFDCQLLTNNIGKKIQYRIELDTTVSTATPIVEDIVIRYILNPVIKKKWTMDLLIASNIPEYNRKMSAKDIDKNLWGTLQKGVIKFTDIDGTVYDATKSGTTDKGVLVSDCKMQGPFPFGETGPEFVATLELLEA